MNQAHIPPTTDSHSRGDDASQVARIGHELAKRSFAVVSTVSAAGHPHAAGVLYAADGLTLYVNTLRTSRKARNIEATGSAAVVVPVRKLPIGPPFTIQFQASAELLALDDDEVVALARSGVLKSITSHGELDEPLGCFLRLRPIETIHTYGIGVSTWALARDPVHVGARSVAAPVRCSEVFSNA